MYSVNSNSSFMEIEFLKGIDSKYLLDNIDKRYWEITCQQDIILLQAEKKALHPFNRTLLEYVQSDIFTNSYTSEYSFIRQQYSIPPFNGHITHEQGVIIMKEEMQYFNENTSRLTELDFYSEEFLDIAHNMFSILTRRILRNKFNAEKDLDTIFFPTRFGIRKHFMVSQSPQEIDRQIQEFRIIHNTFYNDRENISNLEPKVSWHKLMELSFLLAESGLPELCLEVVGFIKDLCHDENGLDNHSSDIFNLLKPTTGGGPNRGKMSAIWPEYISLLQLGDVDRINECLLRMVSYYNEEEVAPLYLNRIFEATLYLYRTKPSEELKEQIFKQFNYLFKTPAHEHYEFVQERIQTLFLMCSLFLK